MKYVVAFIFLLFTTIYLSAQDSINIAIDSIFQKHQVEGCLVLFNTNDSLYTRYNVNYCDTGYIPASTFKIPHSLIALQEDLIRDTNQVIPWDEKERVYPIWNQDQNLATAMKYSCVWVYSDFTNYIDAVTYQAYLNKFEYGNKQMQGPVNLFWLAGTMRITANEQITFMTKLYNETLPVDKEHQQLVKELIVFEKDDNYLWSGKTGGAEIGGGNYIMWLVGFLETEGNTYVYAMNFVANDFGKYGKTRYAIVREVFEYLDEI